MTDGDDRTEDRIRAAFLAERRRAETDLQLEPLAPRARRRSRLVARLAVAAIVVAVAVGTAGLIGSLPGRASSGPTAEPTASSSSSTGPTAGPTAAPTTTPVSRPTVDMTGRYPDGIPTTFDGQPVIRWDAALAKRDTAKDATPFLTGAWLSIPLGAFSCPMAHADPSAPSTTWLVDYGCDFRYVSVDAGALPTAQKGVTTFRFYKGQLETGPAIMRAHIHDPRAKECGYQTAVCDRMIVVDDIAWSGDAVTAPHPLTVADVMAATTQVSENSGLRAPGPNVWGCQENVRAGLLLCPPLEPWTPSSSAIAGANVLPSAEALARALPGAEPGVDAALRSSAIESTGGRDLRRLIVDNVEILIWTDYPSYPNPAEPDRDFLTKLYNALKAQETGS